VLRYSLELLSVLHKYNSQITNAKPLNNTRIRPSRIRETHRISDRLCRTLSNNPVMRHTQISTVDRQKVCACTPSGYQFKEASALWVLTIHQFTLSLDRTNARHQVRTLQCSCYATRCLHYTATAITLTKCITHNNNTM
jgi:hypothetical protein